MISCGARLAPFDIPQLREIMSYDELELDRIGDRKTAVFFTISDTTPTYNFIVALAFSQMFNLLCERADNVHGGRLPHHVRVLWDEAANTGQVPNLEKLVAVIRSREVSLCLFYQQLAQCKAIYDKHAETILGNMDSVIFLGGREASTIKEISENWLGKLSQNTTFQNGRKCHNTWLAGKIKCGCCGYALASLNAPNGVTYMRCKQRMENKSCQGPGTLTKHDLEKSVYEEMVKKMREFQTLKGSKAEGYNPKLTAARAKLAKIEGEIEKLIDTLTGANPLLLQYANSRIEELDAERQKQLKLVADLTANSVSSSQVDSITGYLSHWEDVSFDDRRRVLDTLVSKVEATRTELAIEWKI